MPGRLFLLALLCCCPLWAGEAGGDVEPLEPHPVVVWNRTVAELRVALEGMDVEQRVSRIQRRIESLPDSALAGEIRSEPVTVGGLSGQVIYAGPDLLMALADKDVEPGRDPAIAVAAVKENLRLVLQARLDQRNPQIILWGTIWSVTATVLMLLSLWLVLRVHRLLQARIDAIHLHMKLPHLGGLDPIPALRALLHLSIRLAAWVSVGGIVYSWLVMVLLQFPYTHPLAEVLGNHLLHFGRFLLSAVLGSLPGLGMVLVIVILTRIAARALDSFFTSVENGTIHVNWMEPDTAKATRRIAGAVLWLFAMTVAYPYVPGSSSDAFKGVSVFAGLLLTLGSAGMVNQMMSGLVVVYSRMMKPGDIVKVGDTTGRVIELGFLSTKIRTPVGHEVTLPNAILTGAAVSNFSRFDAQSGPVVSTAVTIGYDTPWRQVHALLELAAARTPGVAKEAKPVVLQTALSDFYVEYQLRCRIERVEDRIRVLSDLHAQIQDAFNEFGVQIMSPHFKAQPAQNVLVPHDKRAPPPAAPA
jgi:small-conductance mechanosensitive channel